MNNSSSKSNNNNGTSSSTTTRITTIQSALARTMPLLTDKSAVPFVCRYRHDVIQPLETVQIHQLADYLERHKTLESLRQKILPHCENDPELTFRVETCFIKSELENIYAPFKPPSKGSLEDRIANEHPELIEAVNNLWQRNVASDSATNSLSDLKPFDSAVLLLANRIAAHPPTMDALVETMQRYGRIQTSPTTAKSSAASAAAAAAAAAGGGGGQNNTDNKQSKDKNTDTTFRSYYEFETSFARIQDHQVLAIRRGVEKKVLKLRYDVDNERMERVIQQSLSSSLFHSKKILYGRLFQSAIQNAWTRLLRKRCTTRLWRDLTQRADERAIQVFCDNLQTALLEPPRPVPVLALDPGYQAGIKCAMLNVQGQVVGNEQGLCTVTYLPDRARGVAQLQELLQTMHTETRKQQQSTKDKDSRITVALGNGHGTQEARKLVTEASQISDIPIYIELVNEAGASVWSVTESAKMEFPNHIPAAVAAVSIGRRFQNALAELVKVPPRSLGLGMYQHDVTEKRLDEKLHLTAVDAVAEVGVDVNACSLEVLEKVPALTTTLVKKVIQSRPVQSRKDLEKVSGLGPKTFENCAAFVRVHGGKEELDATLVHPESYDLARHLLKLLGWSLSDSTCVGDVPISSDERRMKWKVQLEKAAASFDVTVDRALLVLDNLIFSITQPDPRMRGSPSKQTESIYGHTKGCSALPSHLVELDALRKSCPIRSILGTVRNILDFGVFVDYGGESDALAHRSKLGNVSLDMYLVGQEIGIDILGVSKNGKVSASLSGLDHPAESLDSLMTMKRPSSSKPTARPTKRQRKPAPK